VFKPFERAGQEAGPIEGTGIGLTITKRLAELMHGAVGFESTPGSGSAFWVDVPLHRARSHTTAPPPGAEDSVSRLSLQQRTILYVEDNPANVALVREALRRFEEIELVTAPTAEVGLELARRQPLDLVLMDINLPGMDGLAALEALRERRETRAVPVVALTAAVTEPERRRALRAGFDRYLVKPIRIAELEKVLQSLLTEAP
jgi:CheY-like chemotaxis protein